MRQHPAPQMYSVIISEAQRALLVDALESNPVITQQHIWRCAKDRWRLTTLRAFWVV